MEVNTVKIKQKWHVPVFEFFLICVDLPYFCMILKYAFMRRGIKDEF
jgi:hypothetical protein